MSQPGDRDFGPSLARRVSVRTGVRRHTGSARSIGVVSRAAVGFGQAIGRSRQTRPNVTPESLTSLRLRPPAGWWRAGAPHGADAPEPLGARPSWTDDLVPATRHTRRPAAVAPTSSGRPGAAPAPASPVVGAAPTTGLGRLDALRNLIASGRAPDGSSISPDVLHQQLPDDDLPVEHVAPERPKRRGAAAPVVDRHEEPTTAEPAARHALTEAGPATGPGALGRRVQPQPVAPGTTARRTPGGIPTVSTPGPAGSPVPPPPPAGPRRAAAAESAPGPAPIRRTPATRSEAAVPRAPGPAARPDSSAHDGFERAPAGGDGAPARTAGSPTPAERRGRGPGQDARDTGPAAAATHDDARLTPAPHDLVRRAPTSDRDISAGAAEQAAGPARSRARDTTAPASADRAAPPPASHEADASTAAHDRNTPTPAPGSTRTPTTRNGDTSRATLNRNTPAPGSSDRNTPTPAPGSTRAPAPGSTQTPTTRNGDASTAAHNRNTPVPGSADHSTPAPSGDRGTQAPSSGDRGTPSDVRRDRGTQAPRSPAPAPARDERALVRRDRGVPDHGSPTNAPGADPRPPAPGDDAPPAASDDRGAPRPAAHDSPPATAHDRGSPPEATSAARPADRAPSVAPPAAIGSRPADHDGGPGAAPPAPSRAADLRVQRLITSDPAHRVAPAATRTRPAATATPAGGAGQSEFADTLVAPPLARRATERRPTVVPALPGAADGDQPVRRVTLPRAMSRVHRPEPLIGAAREGADRVVAGADTGLGVPPVNPMPRHASARAPMANGRADAQFGDRVAQRTPALGDAQVVRRVERANPADGRTPPHDADPLDQPRIADRGAQDLHRHDRRTGAEPDAVRRVAATKIDADRPKVTPPGPVGRAAEDAGTGEVRHVGRRASIRPPTDVTAASVPPVATAPRPQSSVVRHGADVLRRALAEPTPAQPGTAHGADGWPVAPAARVARDANSPGDDTTREAPTTHAAGQPRSDAGAALAERFMTELSQAVRSRPAPLPSTLRPMADQIAGRRAVMLSTDTASRRALRSVGKRAATVGDTIHVDATASQLVAPSRRITEVVAHELTHVAHPSPAPRFFDDVDESPEERRAEAVARLMARAPLAPTASTLAAPHTSARRASTGSGRTDVVRRSPATGAPSATIRADDLAASLTRPSSPEVVRRQHTVAAPSTPQPTAPPQPSAPQQPPSTPSTPPHPVGAPAGSPSNAIADRDEEFRVLLERNLDVVLRRVEDHILIDIERRGGRAWRGF